MKRIAYDLINVGAIFVAIVILWAGVAAFLEHFFG